MGKEGLKLIEPLCRFSGAAEFLLAEVLYGVDHRKHLISLALGQSVPPAELQISQQPPRQCAFFLSLVLGPGKIRDIQGVEEVSSWPFIKQVDLYVQPGDQVADHRDMTQISGRVYATAPNYFVMEEREKKIKETLLIYDENGNDMKVNRKIQPPSF